MTGRPAIKLRIRVRTPSNITTIEDLVTLDNTGDVPRRRK